jgi:hypothetical protein
LWRWWLVFGVPALAVVVTLVVLGLTLWARPAACPEGWQHKAGTVCVQRS